MTRTESGLEQRTPEEVSERRIAILAILNGPGWWTVDRIWRNLPAKHGTESAIRQHLKKMEDAGDILRSPYPRHVAFVLPPEGGGQGAPEDEPTRKELDEMEQAARDEEERIEQILFEDEADEGAPRIYRDRTGPCPGHGADVCEVCPGDGLARRIAEMEAARGQRAALEILGYVVVDRDGKLYRYQSGEPGHLYPSRDLDIAESFCGSLNRMGDDGPIGLRAPWRVAPVGPVVELRAYGFGVIDTTGNALAAHTYALESSAVKVADQLNRVSLALAEPLPAPFATVQLFYVPPPDRPAEAVEPDPRTERWAAIPKVGKP